jgi:hypothetical protein
MLEREREDGTGTAALWVDMRQENCLFGALPGWFVSLGRQPDPEEGSSPPQASPVTGRYLQADPISLGVPGKMAYRTSALRLPPLAGYIYMPKYPGPLMDKV